MSWWLSSDQRLAEEFVLDIARECRGIKLTPTRIPDWLEARMDRYDVKDFIERALTDQNFWIPEPLNFYGKVTWRKRILEAVAKGA